MKLVNSDIDQRSEEAGILTSNSFGKNLVGLDRNRPRNMTFEITLQSQQSQMSQATANFNRIGDPGTGGFMQSGCNSLVAHENEDENEPIIMREENDYPVEEEEEEELTSAA